MKRKIVWSVLTLSGLALTSGFVRVIGQVTNESDSRAVVPGQTTRRPGVSTTQVIEPGPGGAGGFQTILTQAPIPVPPIAPASMPALPGAPATVALPANGFAPAGWGSGQNTVNYVAFSPFAQTLTVVEDGKYKIISASGASNEERAKAQEVSKEIQAAYSVVRSDKSTDEQLATARTTISRYLKAQFDYDQDNRRKEIANLEEKIKDLKKQIQKREDAKDDLVKLYMTIIENDAEGLGFPTSWTNASLGGGSLGGTFMAPSFGGQGLGSHGFGQTSASMGTLPAAGGGGARSLSTSRGVAPTPKVPTRNNDD